MSQPAALGGIDSPAAEALPFTGPEEAPVRTLASGRSVVVKQVGGGEEVEIRSPQGEVELLITLTEKGPVVRLSGARLELDTPGELAVHCQRLDLHAREHAALRSDACLRIDSQELYVKTTDVLDMKGAPITLNVKDEVRRANWPPKSPGSGTQ